MLPPVSAEPPAPNEATAPVKRDKNPVTSAVRFPITELSRPASRDALLLVLVSNEDLSPGSDELMAAYSLQ